jgi:hypothetical protein
MTSVFFAIESTPRPSPIGCLSFCLTLTVIVERVGCTCPNEVCNRCERNALAFFDYTMKNRFARWAQITGTEQAA